MNGPTTVIRAALTFLILTSGATLAVSQTAEPALGVAHSATSFQVRRGDTALSAPAQSPYMLRTGDLLTTGENSLSINTPAGDSILVDKDSSVALSARDEVRLETGTVAIYAQQEVPRRVLARGLEVSLLNSNSDSETLSPRYAVQSNADETISVASLGGTLRVNSLPDGNQVAVVGNGDVIRFAQLASGDWILRSPTAQFSDDPTDVDDTDVEKGGLFRFLSGSGGGAAAAGAVAVGAGVAAAGTVVVISASQSDDNNDDDENATDAFTNSRQESTPMEPEEPEDALEVTVPISE